MKVLVWVHGWGANSEVWRDTITSNFSQYNNILLSLPGHGATEPIGKDYDLENEELIILWRDFLYKQLQDQLHNLSLKFEKSQLVFIGWSLGGILSIALAQKVKNSIGHVAIASTPKFIQTDTWLFGINTKLFFDYIQHTFTDPETSLKKFYYLQFIDSDFYKIGLNKFLLEVNKFPTPDINSLMQGLQIIQESDLRSDLKNLATRFPTLYILGEKDKLINYQEQLGLPAKVKIIANAGHVPFVTAEKETWKVLKKYLKELI